MSCQPILAVNHLYFDFAERPLLCDINFSVLSGELVHLKGSNGVGKSTLLKLLASLYQPHQGEIKFCGERIDSSLSKYRDSLCYLGHQEGINPLLTPAEYAIYELSMQSFEIASQRLMLQEIAHKPFGLLSAGQKRRVGLLRLVAKPTRLWLLDEPWVALDEQSIHILKLLMVEHLQRRGVVITTSHQPLPFESSVVREYVL